MDRLYQHIHSSYAYHDIYGNITAETNTYVAQRNGETAVVLLYRIEHGSVRVLNEQLRLQQKEVDRFSHYIFDKHATVDTICFPTIENRIGRLSFPYQQPACTHDIVLTLPESAEAYVNKLGKSTRSYIKRYLNKLKRDYPSMTCNTCDGAQASEQDILAIIALNRARMAEKHKSSYIDDAEAERIIKLVRLCGLVTVVTIDGKVSAGTINCRFGDNYFLQVIAHDPAYDEYRLGTLCCYLTICECIARKGREYHFLWGRYEYKYRLLGVQRDLSHLVIYRSRMRQLLKCGAALKLSYEGYRYRTKDWLEHKARRVDNSSLSGKLVYHGLNNLKKFKRSVDRLRAGPEKITGAPRSLNSE
jgi:hypothetical protein